MQRSLALVSASLALALGASAQHVLRTVDGVHAGDHFATCMIDAGDIDHDGYGDVLVGAPGYNAVRGAIYAISGRFLATGQQPSTLWITSPPGLQPGDGYGSSLALVGDLTGDGIAEFAIGAPGDDNSGGTDAGAVWIRNGAASVSWAVTGNVNGERFGHSMDAYGDLDGDGKRDLLVGAPGGTLGKVLLVSGAKLAIGGVLSSSLSSFVGDHDFGWSLACFDFEGDGDSDVLIGSPLSAGSGQVELWLRASTTFVYSGLYTGPNAGDYLGLAVDAADDYDGDGLVDLVVGAPYTGSLDKGRTYVLSGYGLTHGASNPILYSWVPGADSAFAGSAVCASGDLNGDGVGEILTGGPGYSTSNIGRLWIYSGATGEYVGSIVGAAQDTLGYALLGAFDDLDGDGFPEFAVASALSDVNGNDSGLLKCVTLFPVHASSYCTAKINSLGCLPGISAETGFASASSSATYEIHGFDFLNKKSGLLFYGFDANDTPFQDGTLCVKQPIVRTPLQDSGGDAAGSSCTGVYTFDFNAQIQGGSDPHLVVGRQVFCQYWSRDPLSASTTSLSDALRIFVNP